MATVNLGNIKFNWKGTYNAGTAYAVDDVVSYNGSSYVCISATTGNLPTVTAKWEQMSQAGTNGTDVGTTITTQGDLLYRDGSGLQRLAKGTATQILQMNAGATAPEWTAKPEGGLVSTSTKNFNSYANTGTGSAWVEFDTAFRPDIVIANTGSKVLITGMVTGMATSNDSVYFRLERRVDTNGGTSYGGWDAESSTGTEDPTALTAVQQASSSVLGFSALNGNENNNGDGADTMTMNYLWTHGQSAGTRIQLRMLVRTRGNTAKINYTANNSSSALSSLTQFGLMEVKV